MKIKLICIGKVKDKNLLELTANYSKKISFDAKLDIIELKDSTVEDEGKKILEIIDRIKDNFFVLVLSEEGKTLNSIEFSDIMKKIDLTVKTFVFVIGGPYGLSSEVKNKANILLSLSKMTFTHEMCRLFLVEQIYRSISIIKNKKYHKD
jgi:23S rRNA (pseudouridine1915-N3)-methyltransferase